VPILSSLCFRTSGERYRDFCGRPRSLLINFDISHTWAVAAETGNTALTLGFIQLRSDGGWSV